MNKAELTQAIAQRAGLTLKDAGSAIDAFVGAIKDALKKGEKVQLAGFGTWEVKKRAARNGVNPKTGAKIRIKAHKVPKFTAGKNLKEVV